MLAAVKIVEHPRRAHASVRLAGTERERAGEEDLARRARLAQNAANSGAFKAKPRE